MFINIEGMTPREYKNGGENLIIHFSLTESPFGNIICPSTAKGICHLAFTENESKSIFELENIFPNAKFRQGIDKFQENGLTIFNKDWKDIKEIKLHLKGTEFQLKVWEALLKIPVGRLTSYGNLASKLNHPKAARAVGSAIGDNPVAYLIPCHRKSTYGYTNEEETRSDVYQSEDGRQNQRRHRTEIGTIARWSD